MHTETGSENPLANLRNKFIISHYTGVYSNISAEHIEISIKIKKSVKDRLVLVWHQTRFFVKTSNLITLENSALYL